jgi:hypothetical protein
MGRDKSRKSKPRRKRWTKTSSRWCSSTKTPLAPRSSMRW